MNHVDREPINVGLIGFGNIGTGVVRYFKEGKGDPFDIYLKRVAVRDLTQFRAVEFSPVTDNPMDILRDPSIDIVVELIGGINSAKEYTLAAINQGKSIVNANKALLARHMRELFDAARSKQVDMGFEASVGGGIQIISTLQRLKGEEKSRIVAIANGTTNYILTQMSENGLDFEIALKNAQLKGFAEANHILDTGGDDTRDKLAVLASLAWNTQVDVEKISCRGILDVTATDIEAAKDLGYTIRLLAIASKKGTAAELRVTPALIPINHPLAVARNEFNIFYLEGTLAGPQTYYGKGAGEKPTTSAVISDILHIADNIRRQTTDTLPELNNEIAYVDPSQTKQKGYIRVGLIDKPGSIYAASGVISRRGLNMKNSIQREESAVVVDGHEVMQDIITFSPAASYKAIESTLKGLQRSSRVHGTPVFFPIID